MDLQLKKRIIGAVVIVVLLVIFWPRGQQDMDDSDTTDTPQHYKVPTARTVGAEPVHENNGLLEDDTTVEMEDTSAMATQAKSINAGWAIQVASFTNPANATRLAVALEEQGYQVFERNLTRSEVTIIQVFVGPFSDRSQADILASEVQMVTSMQVLVRQLSLTS